VSQPILTLYIPGRTLYVVEYLNAFWNKDTPAWESYNAGNWIHYAIPLAEYAGSGIYWSAFPSQIAAGSLTTEFLYQQNNPAGPVLPGTPGGDSFLTLMQSQGANVQTISGDGKAPMNMAAAADVIFASGVVGSGTITSSSFPTNLPSAPAQAYVGRVIAFTSGICAGQETNITAYTPTGGVVTVTALTNGPSAADTFLVL
jgi:hypothetical protein